MSGGSWEYTMSKYHPSDSDSDASGFEATTTSGTLPTSEYWDSYTGTVDQACNNGICYGRALSETSDWYGDLAFIADASDPWSARGGYYGHATGAGVFDFYSFNGDPYNEDFSFRVVQLKP